MRFIRMTLDLIGAVFEPSRILRLVRIVATVLATSVAVLLVAFMAVAVGLS